MSDKQTMEDPDGVGRQKFEPKGFLEHAVQDKYLSSNTEFPIVYENIKPGDDILKEENRIDPLKQKYLRVDIAAGDGRLVQEDQRITHARIQNLFEARTIDAPYQKTWGRSYYSQHASEVDGKYVVPLSELLEKKRGECVEMATVTQLLLQKEGRKSYLVSGYLEEGPNRQEHTWNVLEKSDGFYILDTKNRFQSKITAVVFEDNSYVFELEKVVPFQYRLR
ncbi:MAG: transglutaminase-like domain-containing protein [Patescibacteria group bacterium]